MTIAKGVFKQLRYAKESSFGVASTDAGQIIRRVTGTVDLAKASFQSQEIRPDQQLADFRHGSRSVKGAWNGELSPGTYKDLLGSLLRGSWASGATTGAQTNLSSVNPNKVSRAAGSFLTDGFKLGDVVRMTGWTTTMAAYNATNLRIVGLTASQLTLAPLGSGVALAFPAKSAGDSVTITVVGKKLVTPASGLLDESYTLEAWFSDIAQSEQYLGCKVSQAVISLPPTGMSTVNFTFLGQNLGVTGTSAYFSSPTAPTTSGVLAAPNGSLSCGGVDVGVVTNLSLTVNGQFTTEPVVGSNILPDIYPGTLVINGQFTALFQDATLRDLFINEVETELRVYLTTNNTAAADFVAFNLQRLKLNGDDKNDGTKGIVQTFPFQALLNVNGGTGTTGDYATLVVQDSLA